MKRANHLLPKISDPDNLRLAAWKAAKGKRYARSVLNFQENLDQNILDLRAQLLSGKVKVGDYRYFRIYDPKEREICASAFPEQVLHHALMNVCHDYFEKVQIHRSYASRKGKGTYAALDEARHNCRRYRWFLKLDVQKFFASIDHRVLKTQLDRMFKERKLRGIFGQIIDSYQVEMGHGLPIGNLCSQYFANHYLTGLDHCIKERLRIKAYVRYMDDMVLWHDDRLVLKQAKDQIADYLASGLQMKLKPVQLNRTRYGLPFLGYLVYPHYLRLSQRSKRRFIRKIRNLDEKYHSGEWSEAICQRRALPLLAFLSHADTHRFRKNVLSRL